MPENKIIESYLSLKKHFLEFKILILEQINRKINYVKKFMKKMQTLSFKRTRVIFYHYLNNRIRRI